LSETLIYELNRQYYEAPGVAERYARDTQLFPVEEVLLRELRASVENRRVLDIGVGAGRTTPHLRRLTSRYIALDYSPRMLGSCKQAHPDCNLLLCDARSLSFASDSFSAVFIFYNAIDDLSHSDRLRVLGEAYRILSPGGVFVFASHNLDTHRKSAFRFSGFVSRGHWLATLRENRRRFLKYFGDIVRHLRKRSYEEHTPDFSIVNDQAYGYRLLTYYIRRDRQIEQLHRAGYQRVQAFDGKGQLLTGDEVSREMNIHYVGWKP
jgi:ubiquinone/menaquinone biosynthesis C-methylase UbiE